MSNCAAGVVTSTFILGQCTDATDENEQGSVVDIRQGKFNYHFDGDHH